MALWLRALSTEITLFYLVAAPACDLQQAGLILLLRSTCCLCEDSQTMRWFYFSCNLLCLVELSTSNLRQKIILLTSGNLSAVL